MQVHTEVTISAAHHLPDYKGKCSNVHGHSWRIEVDIDGSVDPNTGMLVDFSKIKDIINELDHKDLNDIIPNPTAEHIVCYILNRMRDEIPLKMSDEAQVKVWESATSWASDNY